MKKKNEIKEHTILKLFDYLKTLNTYSSIFNNSSNCIKLNFACCLTVQCRELEEDKSASEDPWSRGTMGKNMSILIVYFILIILILMFMFMFI